MKKAFIISIVILSVCSAVAAVDGIITRLGLQDDTAHSYILRNVVGRFSTTPIDEFDRQLTTSAGDQVKEFQIPTMRLLATVAAGDKKAAAQELCVYVKAYVNSPAFKDAYQKAREAAMPESEPSTMDESQRASLKESVKLMEQQYDELKASKMAPEPALAEFKKSIAKIKAELDAQGDPTPNKTKWSQLYPEDPSVAVKARLNEYLHILATVDFSAKLAGTNKRNMKFVNPEYEQKSLKWKAIYRAGKDVNDVASSFAREWLKEQ